MRNIVFCAFETENLTAEASELMNKFLPKERIEKSKRFLRLSDRNNCLAAYFMLLYGLIKEYNLTTIPSIHFNQYGKPFFKDDLGIYFNISHCNNAVCCVLSPYNIGVDIQDRIKNPESIFNMVMSEGEKNSIINSNEPEIQCAKYWSLKEAYLKYKATGLTNNLSEFDFSSYPDNHFKFIKCSMTTTLINDYSISICSEIDKTVIVADNINIFIKDFLSFSKL